MLRAREKEDKKNKNIQPQYQPHKNPHEHQMGTLKVLDFVGSHDAVGTRQGGKCQSGRQAVLGGTSNPKNGPRQGG